MKNFRRAFPLLTIILLFAGISAAAQQPAAASAQPASQAQPAHTSPSRGDKPADRALREPSSEKQLTHASNAAAGKEEEGEENAELKYSPSVQKFSQLTGLTAQQAYWLAMVVNFLIIAAVIYAFTRKSVPLAFRGRTALIQRSMEEARRASEQAQQRLSEIEGRLARLDSEIAGMREAAEKDARAEEERLRAGIEQEKQKIIQSSEQEIAAAANQARRELKAYAAELAVSLAAKRISVNAATDQALVREFSDKLGREAEAGKQPQDRKGNA